MDPQSRIEQKILKFLTNKKIPQSLSAIEKAVRIEGLDSIIENMGFEGLVSIIENAGQRKKYSVSD